MASVRRGALVIAVVSVGLVAFAAPSNAATTWTQNDWSGGVAAGAISADANTYNSATGISAVIPGALTMLPNAAWSPTLSDFRRRVPITVTNASGAATNMQVELVVPFRSGMQADFDDLRFTNAAGGELPYWVQGKSDGVSARVWVRVDALAGAGTTTLYAYFGNAVAVSGANGSATFEFFDDFTGTTIDTAKWDHSGGGGNTMTQNNRIDLNSTVCGWGQPALLTDASFTRTVTTGFVMELDWTPIGDASCWPGDGALMAGWKDLTATTSFTALTYGFYDNPETSGPGVYQKSAGVGPNVSSLAIGTEHVISVAMKPNAGATYRVSTTNGLSWTTRLDNTTFTDTTMKVLVTNFNHIGNFDDVRVRKHHPTSPTAAYGSGETYFSSSATLTSQPFDATVGQNVGIVTFVSSTPVGTTLAVRVRGANNADMSDASAFTACSDLVSGADASTGCAPDNRRYVQYQVLMSSTGVATPSLASIVVNLAPTDVTSPATNASAPLLRRTASDAPIPDDTWLNVAPYVSWIAGADELGGSGVAGYCVYVGTDPSADPTTTKGLLGVSPLNAPATCPYLTSSTSIDLSGAGVLGTPLATSNSAYRVRILVADLAGNVHAGSPVEARFRFDNTPPTNPAYLSAPTSFVATKDVTITWPSSGAGSPGDANSGLVGLQYRIASGGIWYGDSHSGTQDATDLLVNDGNYTMDAATDYPNLNEGTNIVYFRTMDLAGNTSATEVSTAIKINTAAPSAPQSLVASPTTNVTNSFEFSWSQPASYQGLLSAITYCYTVNALPTIASCTYTPPGVTSLAAGPYATQPGDNTLYVVARDEASNINYGTYTSVTFAANTPAPGIPTSIDVADISVRETAEWRVAVSWITPGSVGAGVSNYEVFRSTAGAAFVEVGSVSGTSYVETGLSTTPYTYRVRACDSANNCGAFSSDVSVTPTGKYSTPAALVTAPTVTVSTRTATIKWVTDRDSDSRVQIGLASGQYAPTESASSDQVRSHEIELSNMTAGTTYYFRTRWTDVDGNIGVSSEYTFRTLPSPKLANVRSTGVGISTATVNFTVRDASKIRLLYGKSQAFGGVSVLNTSLAESAYSINLTGLEDGSTYFYTVNTFDADGYEYDQGVVFEFTTPSRPRIENLTFQPVEGQPTSTQMVSWTTNVPATSSVRFGPSGGAQRELGDPELKTQHAIEISELMDDSSYTLVAQSRDGGGNLATSDEQVFRTALDTRPPKVSDFLVETAVIGSGSSARGQLIVSWSTDEPTTSQIAYGEGTGGELGNRSPLDGTLKTEHVVVVSDVSTAAVYSVKAVAADRAGNVSESEPAVGIVNKASENAINIVLEVLNQVFGG